MPCARIRRALVPYFASQNMMPIKAPIQAKESRGHECTESIKHIGANLRRTALLGKTDSEASIGRFSIYHADLRIRAGYCSFGPWLRNVYDIRRAYGVPLSCS